MNSMNKIDKLVAIPKDKTILVVEDERPLLAAVKLKLEESGFEVVTARSVKQALDYLENVPDIQAVWMDHYLMGRDDGLVLVATLKSDNSHYKRVPVFVVSNTASEDKVKAYLNLGVSGYFVKSDNRLDEIVGSIIERIDQSQE